MSDAIELSSREERKSSETTARRMRDAFWLRREVGFAVELASPWPTAPLGRVMVFLTAQQVHACLREVNSKCKTPELACWRKCAALAGGLRRPPTSSAPQSRALSPTLTGIESAEEMTPSDITLHDFGLALDAVGIRGQKLDITDRRGVHHTRGPSKWEQRRYKLNKALEKAKNDGKEKAIAKNAAYIAAHEAMDFAFHFEPVANMQRVEDLASIASDPLARASGLVGR